MSTKPIMGGDLLKKAALTVISIIIVLLVGFAWQKNAVKAFHEPINIADVSRIELWGQTQMKGIAREEEVGNIIKWFNSSTDIRKNEYSVSHTSSERTGIVIELKPRSPANTIIIKSLKTGFEVHRADIGKEVRYWAKQPNLENYLDQLNVKTVSGN